MGERPSDSCRGHPHQTTHLEAPGPAPCFKLMDICTGRTRSKSHRLRFIVTFPRSWWLAIIAYLMCMSILKWSYRDLIGIKSPLSLFILHIKYIHCSLHLNKFAVGSINHSYTLIITTTYNNILISWYNSL